MEIFEVHCTEGGIIINNKSIFAYILVVLPLLITVYLIINPNHLIPAGYELAIDGYVISRTIIIIFGLYLLFKLGTFLFKQKDS